MLTNLTATCGHDVIYTPLPDDPYHAAKVAKITGQACRSCRLKAATQLEATQKATGKARREKKAAKKAAGVRALGLEPGELRKTAVSLMPDGTVLQLRRTGDRWHGVAVSGGRTLKATGHTPVAVLKKLAAAVCFDDKGAVPRGT